MNTSMPAGYSTRAGRFANLMSVVLYAAGSVLAAVAAGVASPSVELGDRGTMRLNLAVTAFAGTAAPTLAVTIQTSPDNVNWTTIVASPGAASFTNAAGVTTQRLIFTGLDRFVRALTTVTGTNPSFTFSLTGEAC